VPTPREEAEAIVRENPDLVGPQHVIENAETLFATMVPDSPFELDYLAGRIALTVEETRMALGIGQRALEHAIANGDIPSVKIGGRRLIPKRALERHLEAMAYAASGSLDAWQNAIITGQSARIKRARRLATEKRSRMKKRLRTARAAVERAGSEHGKDVLISMRADLAVLEREVAVTDKFRRDIEKELDDIERDL
jgi:excisionase family DNA binding protein